MMKKIQNIIRILVAIVFLFSGFVKGIDPLGSTYKFSDYFTAFGLEFLDPLALPLAILLSTLEFVLGAAMLFNSRMRIASWLALIFMAFFTPLTLYLALENPVQDCGCFGDAIIMTNWETFWKNVIITLLVVFVFIRRNKFQPSFNKKQQWLAVGLSAAAMVSVSFYCYTHLPIIDFRPYNVETYIPEKMKIPEDAPQPEFKTILIYKKNGKIKEFTMDNLPYSTWQWVSTKNIKVKEGYVPPIHDFTITTREGTDITDLVLEENKFVFLLIAYDLKKTDRSDMDQINDLASYCKTRENCSFICLTSSLDHAIEKFKNETGANFSFYMTDEITLKTIIRSNPGLMLMKKGTILDKWHHNTIPEINELEEEYLSNPKFQKNQNKNKKGKTQLNS